MECIKEFLKDEYQSQLRLFAQGKSERYENTVEEYKKIFLAHYKLVKSENSICDKCIDMSICQRVRESFNDLKDEEIGKFFDVLRQIYLDWIDSNLNEAIKKLNDLLESYNLLTYIKNITDTQIYFKARNSENVLTKWDMFHIPFNKRYLIENQRYSLTGQPVLYIGSSVIDVASEIEIKDISKLKVSLVQLPVESGFKIYELYCDVSEVYSDMTYKLFLGNDTKFRISYFFKMILSWVCSFQKRKELKGYSFCEEYVIPQILALVLRQNGFDGISYISTKKYGDVDIENNRYKENIAIFTKIDTKHVYDRSLFNKIIISVPIDISKISEITLDNIKELQREISMTHSEEKIKKSEIICSLYNRIYDKIKIKGQDYSKSEYGKIHLYEIYCILNEILVAL